MYFRSVRALVLSFMLLVAAQYARGQFEVGIGAGAFQSAMRMGDTGSGSPWIRPSSAPAHTAALYYRDQLPSIANFFAEVSWSRRAFMVHFDNSGRGGGVVTDLDVKMDVLHLCFGPEFGTRVFSFRGGIQIGRFLGGTATGIIKTWSMSPGPTTTEEASGHARDYFNGDIRMLAALRLSLRLGAQFSIIIDPYMSVSISSMSRQSNSIHGIDAGIRLGFFRFSSSAGFWKRLRSGGPGSWQRLRAGAPSD